MTAAVRRTTIVTGGARRLGAEIVRSFAARGDAIVLHHGNSARDAEHLSDELLAGGTPVHIVRADLTEAGAPAYIVAEAMRVFGAVDVVVSSASVMQSHAFEDVTPAEWDVAVAVNLRAPFFLMQAAALCMREGGVIIQLADHLANEAIHPRLIPHQVSKSALTQLVRAVAARLAPKIRVNAVAPGLVVPPDGMTADAQAQFLVDVPLARAGTSADVTQAIHYLVDAPYVTGIVLTVDGGRHLWR